MKTRHLTVALLLVLPQRAAAQQSIQAQFDSAYYAWDAGRYVEALEGLERLLSDPGGDELLERIALLTGELYHVTEIALDGRAVRWSPDGRYAAYETGTATELTTHIVAFAADSTTTVAEMRGSGLVFAPAGDQVAYLTVLDTPEHRQAIADLQSHIQARDRATMQRIRTEMARVNAEHSRIVVRQLQSARERTITPNDLGVHSLSYGTSGETVYFVGNVKGDAESTDIYQVTASGDLRRVTAGPGRKDNPRLALRGTHLVYTLGGDTVGVVELATGRARFYAARSLAVSADGTTLAFSGSEGDENVVKVVSLQNDAEPLLVSRTPHSIGRMTSQACPACPTLSSIALSPDGSRVAFQVMPRDDWELYLVGSDGSDETRLTRDIQHDLFPQFISNSKLLALMGESRHRRSHLYDLMNDERSWLFRNNTVRTVAPEYEWALSPDGTRLLIVAERDGDTVSPERGVYLLDLSRKVTKVELLERIRRNLTAELDLRERGRKMYEIIADDVKPIVAAVSTLRIYDYARDLFSFDSKHITQPGNRLAIDYLVNKLRSFGYEPELQWFEPRGTRTANVIATLRGTIDPELVYVVSSHFDSNSRSPGADDNSSATTALLEAARVLAHSPMPATIKFAFFTGEEAGLLGSREFVRRAVEAGEPLVGALNNDMVGWAENHRLDNTIRYSNVGIRDVQHAAAFLFSDLITHDAKYYKSTDAHAYYEAYGDIVGGIGSYPILASPHYHQVTDVLETVNHQLVAEVSKTTIASIMLLASSPSRLTGIEYERRDASVEVWWNPAVESDATHYIVTYGPPGDPSQTSVTINDPRVTLSDAEPGSFIAVKAVNSRGMAGWDWSRIELER